MAEETQNKYETPQSSEVEVEDGGVFDFLGNKKEEEKPKEHVIVIEFEKVTSVEKKEEEGEKKLHRSHTSSTSHTLACSSNSTTTTNSQKGKQQQYQYRGIRVRNCGRWIAEIRKPKKKTRIWLGSYATPVAAARAYDTALFYFKGPSACFNFPEQLSQYDDLLTQQSNMSTDCIQKKAIQVGTRVDAQQTVPGELDKPPAVAEESSRVDRGAA